MLFADCGGAEDGFSRRLKLPQTEKTACGERCGVQNLVMIGSLFHSRREFDVKRMISL